MDMLAQDFPAYIELQRDIVVNSILWTPTAQIMAADFGFEGIIGVPGFNSVETIGAAIAAGAGVNLDYAALVPTPPLRNIAPATSVLGTASAGFGAFVTLADALPIEVSWPLLPSTVSPTDIAITLNTGDVVTPQAAALNPNYDYNERHVIVVFGQFGNRLTPGTPGAIYPVSVSFVDDGTPLQAIGPNGPLSLVGLSASSVSPYANGPRLLGARLTRYSSVGDYAPQNLSNNAPNDGATLYGNDAAYRLRLFTNAGFSPDGVSPILPSEFSSYFRLAATDANGQPVTLTQTGVDYDLGTGLGTVQVVGLAELGRAADGTTVVYGPYYTEDHDNYVDIILKGDEAAIRHLVSVDLPTSAVTGYNDIYSPGGPGRTPTTGVTYTVPAPAQTIAISFDLENAQSVSYAAQTVASYDAADGLPVVFRLHNAATTDTIYTASTNQAATLQGQGYQEKGVPFSNETNSLDLVQVREFYSAGQTDHLYTADAAEITQLSANGSGYVDQGVVFSAIGQAALGARAVYRFHSASLGDHLYTPDLSEGFTTQGYGYDGIAWYAAALVPGLGTDVVFDRPDDVRFGDALSGSGSLTKRGTGTLTLSGTNTLTGATLVEAGTLEVSGALAASAVALAAGATLKGTGTVGAVTASGHIAPGASIGTLAAIGTVAFGSGASLDLEIDPGAGDRLAVTGAVTIADATLSLLPQSGSYTDGTSYDVITATGGITGSFASLETANSDRLGGLVVSTANLGTLMRLTLAAGATLTAGADTVSFNGSAVTTDIIGLASNDTLAFSSTGNSVAAAISGTGLLTVGTAAGAPAALTLLSGAQSVAAVEVRPNASLSVNSTLNAGTVTVTGTLGGTGTVVGAVTNQGTLAPGNSPGILSVDGAITNDGTAARLEIDIDGPSAGTGAGFHDQIRVTGSPGSFTAAGTLVPITRGISGGATNAYTPSLGQSFSAVTATGGVFGSFAGLTQPGSGLPAGTRFDAVYRPTTLDLVVTPAAYGQLAAAGLGQTANQQQAGQAIDALRPPAGVRPNGDLKTVLDSLYPLGAAQIAPALDQIAGAIHADAGLADLGARRLVGRMIESHLAEVRSGGGMASTMASAGSFQFSYAGAASAASQGLDAGDQGEAAAGAAAPNGTPQLAPWSRLIGSYGSHSGDGNAAGFEHWTGGALVGGDIALAPDFRLGGGFGYARTELTAEHNGGTATIDGYQALLYGSKSLGRSFVDAQIGYAFTQYDTSRPIAFGPLARTAEADAHGHDFSVAIAAGRDYRFATIRVEPVAGLRYDLISRSTVSENGADALNLSLRSERSHFLQTSLGARARSRLDLGGLVLEPEASLAWSYDALGRSPRAHPALGGAHFTVDAPQPGRHAASFGIGTSAALGDRFQAFMRYDGQWRDNQTDHALLAGLRYAW
ncbi:MAG: autotransporter domain-containing protein [Azospirillum sp.]|nr:autotransporter domain-containing protein [Azospirillum sp.]